MPFGRLRVILSALMLSSLYSIPAFAEPPTSSTTSLHGLWQMQSSCTDKSPAEAISTSGFAATNWHQAEVPGTVVAALVADKTLSDPDFGMNLKSFPGVSLGGEEPFSNRDMPTDSPFRCSYWFRTEFSTPANAANKSTWLHFLGINYRANIWLNGKKIADRADVAGAYRSYEFRITELLRAGGKSENALAVEIFAPEKNDLGLTWVDWNPTPPDKDMGMWREVFLSESGEVALRAPFATCKLTNNYNSAELTLSAELRNTTNHPVDAVLHADVEGDHLSQPVQLAANETKVTTFSPDQFPKLKLAHPHLWWPYQMGEPFLYSAKFRVEIGKELSDSAFINFGIREVTSELTPKGGRLFKVNGRKVLIRGAAWTPHGAEHDSTGRQSGSRRIF
jgi:exo-1,4-beta-D-glucosaminidase